MRKLLLSIGILAMAGACGSSGGDNASGGGGDDAGAEGSVANDSGANDSGADDSGGGTDGPGVDGTGGDAGCGQAMCDALGAAACGATTDACGQSVTCGLCKYSKDTVPSVNGAAGLALVTRGGLALAYASGPTVSLATKGSSWTSEPAGPGAANGTIDLAIAPDGTPWIAIRDTTNVSVAHKSGGAWTVDTIPGFFERSAIAAASDGTPYLAVAGSSGGAHGVLLFHYAAGAWTPATVAPGSGSLASLDVAAAGAVPWVAWVTDSNEVHVAHADGSTFADETVAKDGNFQIPHGIGIDVDDAGVVHIGYGSASHGAVHAVRGASGWQTEPVGGSLGSMDEVRFAAGPNGKLVVAWVASRWIQVVANAGGKWFMQTVVPGCENSALDLGFDTSGVLVVAHSCKGTPTLLVQSGTYPADYAAGCAALSTALCQKGAACTPDAGRGECCIVHPNGRSCPQPEWYCEVETNNAICGDATLEPPVASACAQAIPQATCASGQPGVQLPAACPFAD